MFYDDCLKICQEYFSDNAKSFLDRQIKYHLNKGPQNLVTTDKEELIYWLRVSAALVIGKEKANALVQKIMSL